jgi:hypothetical protein
MVSYSTRVMAILLTILALPVGWLAPAMANELSRWQTDQLALTARLRQFASPGLPGVISSFNNRSFVVVAGKNNRALSSVIAAGELDGLKKGRIVAFGHDGYLDAANLEIQDTRKLFLRLALWAAHKPITDLQKKNQRLGQISLVGHQNLGPLLTNAGWTVKSLGGNWADNLDRADLVVISPGYIRDKDQADALRQHLVKGGGLLFGITGWGWEQISGGRTLVRDLPLTPVLAEAGLAVSNATADPTSGKFMAVSTPDQLALVNAGKAFERLKQANAEKLDLEDSEVDQIGASLLMALRAAPANDTTFRKGLTEFLEGHQRQIISRKNQINRSNILDRLAIQIDHEIDSTLPAISVKANPNASEFPGPVAADAPKITKTIDFPKGSRGRLGTGLYAAPGSVVALKLVKGTIPQAGRMRIGNHSDTLWHLDRWPRHPEISRIWPLNSADNSSPIQVANAFGGLIYLETERPLVDGLELEISGVVAAPHFILDKTDLKEWDRLRSAPAPWAELQSRHVGLTLPSSSIRDLKDPRPLLQLWDQVIATQDQLGPLNPEYKPIQWVVPDIQISAGYMHSGNPIMTLMDVVPIFSSDHRLLNTVPGGISWGILHEIGHNRQHGEWTPDGLGEVTNNLFALYVYDKMLGKPSLGHPGLLVGSKRVEALAEYRKTGPNFEKFQNDPFLALAFFMEMQESFGWEPFIKFFAESDRQPLNLRPKTDTDRWDGWLKGMSNATGKNLGPYFQMWGIPVSKMALESVKMLGKWSPKSGDVGE